MSKPEHKQAGVWRATDLESYSLLPYAGYALLAFSIINFLHILIPPNFTNPTWELQTMELLIGQVWAPLLGLILIFSHRDVLSKWEVKCLAFLSWLSLFFGLFYLLMLPLGVHNTRRVNQLQSRQIAVRIAEQRRQIQLVKSRLQAANTPEDIMRVAGAVNGRFLPEREDVQALRQQFLDRIEQADRRIQSEGEERRENAKVALIKDSLKSNLIAIVAGIWFIGLWWKTRWVRRLLRSRRSI